MNQSSSNSASRKPVELVDRYLQAVRFWLPKSRRQEDLIAELGEDLRSQIDEKENELGRPLDEAEIAAILKRCGSPMTVAARLGPKRHLIGPGLFPIYGFVLKMVLLWILVPVFIFIVGPVNLANANGNLGEAIAKTLANLWSGLFIAAGIVTLVFAVLERTSAQFGAECKWDPLKLPPLRTHERKTSFVHTLCEMIFGWFGLIWLLLLPHKPFLILGPGAAFLTPGPMWHAFYIPIVLLAVAALLRPGIALAKPQWTWFPPVAQLVSTALSLLVLNFILNVAAHPPGGHLQLVVLKEAAQDSPQYIRVAAIVNVSILISLVSAWIGLCIAGIVQLWQVLRYVTRRITGEREPASLQFHKG